MTAQNPIRIIIADDHAIVREGLKQILADSADMVVSGDAENGVDAIKLARRGDADVLLLDISMADRSGIDVLKQVKKEVPKLAVGCAGNAWIPLTVYNVITGVIDGKLGAQQAIEAPRFLPGRDPADPIDSAERVEIEDRFPRAELQDLIGRGHRFQKIGRKGEVRYGYAAAIVVDVAGKKVEGGAEPRRAHAAVPFDGRITTTAQQK